MKPRHDDQEQPEAPAPPRVKQHKLLWNVTLAATLPVGYDLTTLPYPLYASPKLDGVRATVQRGVLVSRSGRPIANLHAQALFSRKEYEGLDGELTVGPPNGLDVFNRTVRVTQKRDADAGGLRFNVFDTHPSAVGRSYLNDDLKFEDRKFRLLAQLDTAALRRQGVHIVKQTLVRTPDQLLSYEATQLEAGYEGVMLRRADAGLYMEKRSTLKEFSLVKFKRMETAEAVIIAIYPLRHNDNTDETATGRRSSKKTGIREDDSLIGSALLRDVKTKVEFTVNVPTDELRAWPGWKNLNLWRGQRVRYKYQMCGTLKGGAPRFPTATFEELR